MHLFQNQWLSRENGLSCQHTAVFRERKVSLLACFTLKMELPQNPGIFFQGPGKLLENFRKG